ncbi:MAG TPA: DUF4013 domain-containing protein [Thermoflexia bacterium]|nr:DUF4013 domain-containing protein [Thermoflexia bacterium]
MDIGKALGFVFEDEEWVSKILLGALITLIPIFGGFALMGYAIALIRNVMAGEPRPLPVWDDLGRYFMDGLTFWVATLVYALPSLILICPVMMVWLLPALAGENENLMKILTGISGLVSVGLGCLALLYGILLALLTPVLQIRYAETGELGACLRFGDIFRFLFDNIGSIIIAQVLMWVAGVIIGSVVSGLAGALSIVPICGWILAAALGLLMLPVGVWLMAFSGHLYGQIGRQAGTAPLVV